MDLPTIFRDIATTSSCRYVERVGYRPADPLFKNKTPAYILVLVLISGMVLIKTL
jgi:hypothetical protein